MPIGSSKLGVLGAGLVPGGTETFNAPGTFSIPPGVKKVSITGKGGTGNPGVAGNPGNPGNPGSGGGGAAGGLPNQSPVGGGAGGSVIKFQQPGGNLFLPGAQPGGGAGSPLVARGGRLPSQGPGPICGGAGASGSAGSAGNAGNPGNSGQPSSGLCNTFPGGCGGNAGVAGAAGNAGTGGPGGIVGGTGSPSAAGNPGPAGPGGGAGGSGSRFAVPNPGSGQAIGGQGGGGAGAVNSGATGRTFPFPGCCFPRRPVGGTGNVTGPVPSPMPTPYQQTPSTQGGPGGAVPCKEGTGGISIPLCPGSSFNMVGPFPSPCSNRNQISQFSPGPAAPEVFRSGAGGGAGGDAPYNAGITGSSGGGGGGGARGNAGNAGGGSPTPSGAAATPQRLTAYQ
jgi:hypothetical protein